MTPKEELKAEQKRITTAIKSHFRDNEKLISGVALTDVGVSSTVISDNIINQTFYTQKEIYFNSEFSKFKTVIKQQLSKAGLKPVEYTLEYIVKNLNAELPNKKFTHSENTRAYRDAISEYLEDLKAI